MEFQHNIGELYARVFLKGRGLPFPIPPKPQEVKPGEVLTETPGVGGEEGTEFINMRNTIKSNMPDGRPVFMPCQIGSLVLPNEPTLEISAAKRIQKTDIVGNTTRRGSVKELIYTGDYEIRIRGVALNYESSAAYPEDVVKDLNDLYLENRAQPIQCALTLILGISDIVIESIWFPHTPGPHAQAYEIIAHSDEAFELDIDA